MSCLMLLVVVHDGDIVTVAYIVHAVINHNNNSLGCGLSDKSKCLGCRLVEWANSGCFKR